MGLVACLLFGIIATWITQAIQPAFSKGGLMILLFTGLFAGIVGCFAGISIGWGDLRMFNLYNVLLAMAFGALFAAILGKVWSPRETLKPVLEPVTETAS